MSSRDLFRAIGQIDDDLIEFEIEEGELKQMAKNVAIDTLSNENKSFEELFNQVLTQIED